MVPYALSMGFTDCASRYIFGAPVYGNSVVVPVRLISREHDTTRTLIGASSSIAKEIARGNHKRVRYDLSTIISTASFNDWGHYAKYLSFPMETLVSILAKSLGCVNVRRFLRDGVNSDEEWLKWFCLDVYKEGRWRIPFWWDSAAYYNTTDVILDVLMDEDESITTRACAVNALFSGSTSLRGFFRRPIQEVNDALSDLLRIGPFEIQQTIANTASIHGYVL